MAIQRWTDYFSIPREDWEDIFLLPYKCTIEEKLRNFQIKLLHWLIPTNSFLYDKISLSETDKCILCISEKETILHLFLNCPKIKQFWTDLQKWLISKQIPFQVNPPNILIGQNYKEPNRLTEQINLLAKYYIHCCKYTQSDPYLEIFKLRLTYIEYIERTISIQRDTHEQHRKKWSKFLANLD